MAKRHPQTQNKREQRETQRRREQNKKYLTWGGISLLVVGVIGVIFWLASQSTPVAASVGEFVTIGPSDHVPAGTDPGPYKTNPPTGGKHYPEEADEKFYEESDAAKLPRYQEGYLVHNLEHGYIIFWYNCNGTPRVDCNAMKADIRKVMDEFNGEKMIAFPWPSQKEPLVLTSWDRIMRLDGPDLEKMRSFYRANLNKAPEPMAE